MSDRVRALGVGNGLPGPPTLHPTAIGDQYYPLELTAEEVIKWYWRVKNWIVSGTFSILRTPSGSPVGAGQITTGPSAFEDHGSRERDLVFALGIQQGWGFETAGDYGPDQGDLNFNIFTDGTGVGFYYKQIGDKYYPFISVGGTLRFSAPPMVTFATNGAGVDGTTRVTIDGKPIDVPLDLNLGPDDSYVLTDLDFTIGEYWPYAAKDSTPIYNTTTGAQLQSPLL